MEAHVGVTLLARNREHPLGFAFDITCAGWGDIRCLLRSLGCDMHEVAAPDDGDEISEATLIAWADAIDGAVARDELRHVPCVPEAAVDVPATARAIQTLLENVGVHYVDDRLRMLIRPPREGGVRATGADCSLFQYFADWARHAGGCSQW
jgi:hypothetical protein